MAASTSVLEPAGSGGGHPRHVRLPRDDGALLHERLLVGRLDLPQLGDHRQRVDERDVHEAVARLGGELVDRRQRRRRRRTRTEGKRQRRAIGADGVEERVELVGDLAAADPVRPSIEHRGHEALELAGVVDLLDPALRGGFLLREAVSVPVLPPRVRLADEQDLLLRPVARHQHEDRALLHDPGEVQHVAVLAELVVRVERVDLRLRAPEDGERARPQTFDEAGPPGRQVVLQRPCRRGRREHQHAHRRHQQPSAAIDHRGLSSTKPQRLRSRAPAHPSVPNQKFGDKYSGRGARIARREERAYRA